MASLPEDFSFQHILPPVQELDLYLSKLMDTKFALTFVAEPLKAIHPAIVSVIDQSIQSLQLAIQYLSTVRFYALMQARVAIERYIHEHHHLPPIDLEWFALSPALSLSGATPSAKAKPEISPPSWQ